MKKISIILCFSVFLLCIPVYAVDLSAGSAVLMEAESGRILFSKDMSVPKTMASTTKIMTGIVAIETGNMEDVVTVSQKAASQEGTSMYLKAGEKIKMEELLYGLMLSSGNDAAVAIAEHISGSTEKFAEIMTNMAKEAGALSTSFKNPNGLDEEGHITTAYDMAKITAYAMKNNKFREIVSAKNITTEKSTYTNHNKLLGMYEGVCGVKTGYTKKSGRCLVSACERGGITLICVTLNAPDDWNDHMKLYDFGFGNYSVVTPYKKGDIFATVKAENSEVVPLVLEKNISLFLSEEEQKRLNIVNDTPVSLTIPVKKGSVAGNVSAYLDGEKIAQSNLICEREILPPEKEDIVSYFLKALNIWFDVFI